VRFPDSKGGTTAELRTESDRRPVTAMGTTAPRITPALREFASRCLVPILLEQYLRKEIRCIGARDLVECATATSILQRQECQVP
jgi:hypothetical protein